MDKRKTLIIGEVYIDHHLDIKENGVCTSRLGGIFHAARSCEALSMEYALAYYAPSYLEKDIKKFGKDVLGASNAYCLGNVDKAPNVILVGESDESGSQLYENILCEQAEYISRLPLKQVLDDFKPTDIEHICSDVGFVYYLEQNNEKFHVLFVIVQIMLPSKDTILKTLTVVLTKTKKIF